MRVGGLKRLLRGTIAHRIYRRLAHGTESRVGDAGSSSQSAVYDRQTIEVMRRVLRADSSCVDIGAHQGDILKHMIAIAPSGRHHAFEPLPHLAAELRRRFRAVRIHEVALSDRNGEAEFQYVENDPAYSGLRRRVYDRPDPVIVPIRVAVAMLDEIIPDGQPVAFMKLDIEGGEYHALKGATNTIRRCHPVIVFEAGRKSTGEYGVTPTDLYGLVTETLGYDLSTMGRWLERTPPMRREEFCHNWVDGPEFYFIATPT